VKVGTTVGIGDPFPDFELPDLEGHTWTRTDVVGKPSVLFLFSSW
jgi:peroxiredoxin